MDQEQFESLYLRWETPLYNAVYRWLWRESEAQDVVQEAFVRFWEARERVRSDGVKGWLFRTALNLAANRLRRRRILQWVGLEDGLFAAAAGGAPGVALAARERELAVRKAVMSLPEKHRRVLVLFRFGEMSQKEIAATLNIPEGTVASRHRQGAALLKRKLESMGVAYER